MTKRVVVKICGTDSEAEIIAKLLRDRGGFEVEINSMGQAIYGPGAQILVPEDQEKDVREFLEQIS